MEKTKSDILYLIRVGLVFLATTLLCGAVFAVVLREINFHQNILEGGLVEKTQAIVLLVAGIAYVAQATCRNDIVNARVLSALFIFTMLVRECDGFFDRITGNHNFWFYIVCAILVFAIVYALLDWRMTLSCLTNFVKTEQFLMLAIGAIFAIVIAQLIGYKEIWNTIFDHPELGTHEAALARNVKNTVEESFELASYLIILASSFLPQCLRQKPIDAVNNEEV